MSTDLDHASPNDPTPEDPILEELAQFDDLRDLMTRALADLDVPTHRLGDRAELDGRRLRRRRRALVAAGGFAAAATVAAFAVPLAGGSGNTAHDAGYAGSPPTMSATDLADLPAPFVDRPGYWDMPAAEMAARLADLLPKRIDLATYERTNTDHAPGEPDVLIGVLRGTLSSPTGPGSVNVMLTQLPDQAVLDAAKSAGHAWGDQDFGCPPELGSTDTTVLTCATKTDASGRVVQRELETRTAGVTYREVRIVTHGGTVYVATANSTQRKWTAPPSASQNPLTLDELGRIATSAAWTSWRPSSS